MDSKVIVLFNHKGGVSKTTTTYHVGWKLTEYGKKVLLVDGDPQCNLTSLLLGEYFDEYYTNSQTSLDKGTQRKTTENELPSLTQCTA